MKRCCRLTRDVDLCLETGADRLAQSFDAACRVFISMILVLLIINDLAIGSSTHCEDASAVGHQLDREIPTGTPNLATRSRGAGADLPDPVRLWQQARLLRPECSVQSIGLQALCQCSLGLAGVPAPLPLEP